MQFPEKLKNQTLENGKKKTNFGPNIGLFGPNLDHHFFVDFNSTGSYSLFQAIILFSLEENNKPNLRKYQKPNSGPILVKYFFREFYLY